MSTSGQPNPQLLEALVAASLLRTGGDTVAGRVARDLLPEVPAADLVRAVAERIWVDDATRRRNVLRACGAAERALQEGTRLGMQVLAITDEGYPELLKAIPDPPLVLWIDGQVAALREPAVGVVGSRAATPTSLAVARTLGRELAEAGLTVVSGLARGVDGAAHGGALEAGRTVAVLGSGLDHIYPHQHKALAMEIVKLGAVISELPPGSPPSRHHFPMRNRIISGLCRAVVVVEASDRSGSLITARMAAEQGRDVLAVPGGILSGSHRGCHGLIRDGARLVETVGDILEEIGWILPPAARTGSDNHLQLSDLEANMAVGEPYSVEDLARCLGRDPLGLLPELGRLEVAGRVTRLPAGHFMRLVRRGRGD